MQNDVERMRDLANGGLLDAGKSKPAVHEYDLHAGLLASILVVLQSAYATEGSPRPTPVTPATARDVLDEETAQADIAAIHAGGLRVTDAEYLAWVGGEELAEGTSLLTEL